MLILNKASQLPVGLNDEVISAGAGVKVKHNFVYGFLMGVLFDYNLNACDFGEFFFDLIQSLQRRQGFADGSDGRAFVWLGRLLEVPGPGLPKNR